MLKSKIYYYDGYREINFNKIDAAACPEAKERGVLPKVAILTSGLFNYENRTIHPQNPFPFDLKPVLLGLESDGKKIKKYDMAEHCKNSYFVLFFFPMDFRCDSSEVLAFSNRLKEFEANHIRVLGVTHDSPFVLRHWVGKPVAKGGFGRPVGFPLLSDKDCVLAQALGVAQANGMPARATFVVDWNGNIRYLSALHTRMGRNVDEILRICRAFRHSDLTGKVTPPTWQRKGDDTVPTDFKKKMAWYQAKFGGNKIVKQDTNPSLVALNGSVSKLSISSNSPSTTSSAKSQGTRASSACSTTGSSSSKSSMAKGASADSLSTKSSSSSSKRSSFKSAVSVGSETEEVKAASTSPAKVGASA